MVDTTPNLISVIVETTLKAVVVPVYISASLVKEKTTHYWVMLFRTCSANTCKHCACDCHSLQYTIISSIYIVAFITQLINSNTENNFAFSFTILFCCIRFYVCY